MQGSNAIIINRMLDKISSSAHNISVWLKPSSGDLLASAGQPGGIVIDGLRSGRPFDIFGRRLWENIFKCKTLLTKVCAANFPPFTQWNVDCRCEAMLCVLA